MTPRPEDLYRAVILDHARHPRHPGRLAAPNALGEAHNALCGDRAAVTLNIAAGRVTAAACDAVGCAINVAAGSLLASAVTDRPVDDARATIVLVHALVRGDDLPPAALDAAGELRALAGLGAFPARRRCATLACEALDAALDAAPTP